MLNKKEKEKLINALTDSLSKCTIAVATDYRGLNAKEMVKLRKQLRTNGIEYRVAKNTLTKFAADRSGRKQLEPLLTGPLAIAFGFDDVVKPAKVIYDFIRSSGAALQIKGGLLGDRLLSAQDIVSLANIPPKQVLISQLVGQLVSPLYSLHTVLSAPLRGFAYVLQARIRQMEGGEGKKTD
jgi:large subunit ribosomal protein L10